MNMVITIIEVGEKAEKVTKKKRAETLNRFVIGGLECTANRNVKI